VQGGHLMRANRGLALDVLGLQERFIDVEHNAKGRLVVGPQPIPRPP
jgi:hypothetical protein